MTKIDTLTGHVLRYSSWGEGVTPSLSVTSKTRRCCSSFLALCQPNSGLNHTLGRLNMSGKHSSTQQTFSLTGFLVLWLGKSRSGRCRTATEDIGCYPNLQPVCLTATTRKRSGRERHRGEPIRAQDAVALVQWRSSGGGATLVT